MSETVHFGQPDEPDHHLLAELGDALGPDTPPADLIERAEGLVDFMGTDRELVELLDGAAAEVAGLRASAGASTDALTFETTLTFETAAGSVSLELSPEPEGLRGQVLAGEITTAGLQRLTGEVATVEVDELGRFGFPAVPAGPARLVLRLPGADRPAMTDWFVL
jgi:hypothetical protein